MRVKSLALHFRNIGDNDSIKCTTSANQHQSCVSGHAGRQGWFFNRLFIRTVTRLCVTVKQRMAKVASPAEGRLAVNIYFRKAKSS
jgi:hypothetical protein